MNHPATRNTLKLEDGTVISHQEYDASQFVLRIESPAISAIAKAGSFVHLSCDDSLPMRRPLSIMRVNAKQGWLELLYKIHGQGTDLLSQRVAGDSISLLGPIGNPFKQDNYRKRPLLIGGGVGIPPMVFLAEHLKTQARESEPLVIMGSEIPFPFKSSPSKIMVPGIPAETIACMPLLEDWGIASRLCSLQSYPGCFDGYVTDLARLWLKELPGDELEQVEIFSCGPTPMLKAVAALAAEFSLPCQVSLEEYMACAVGGCAGCTVLVQTEDGPAMKRVCVDGPVFDAYAVYPA